MTADCLPVLFCSQDGTEVAAAHAGWRGLCAGVLENTLAQFRSPPDQIHAWLGPAIGPDAFEVGEEVRQAFMAQDPRAVQAFRPSGDRFYADIGLLAQMRLQAAGVNSVSASSLCTFTQRDVLLFPPRWDHRAYGNFDLAVITLRHKTVQLAYFLLKSQVINLEILRDDLI